METISLLALGAVAFRLVFPLIRPTAGLNLAWSWQDTLSVVLGALLGVITLGAWGMALFAEQGPIGGRLDATGMGILVVLLYGIPLARWLGEDWVGVSDSRKIRQLPPGQVFWNIPVKIGTWAYVNLVIDPEGVCMARRGLPGLWYSPFRLRWTEFTNYKVSPGMTQVALLDGRMLVFTGEVAEIVATTLAARRRKLAV